MSISTTSSFLTSHFFRSVLFQKNVFYQLFSLMITHDYIFMCKWCKLKINISFNYLRFCATILNSCYFSVDNFHESRCILTQVNYTHLRVRFFINVIKLRHTPRLRLFQVNFHFLNQGYQSDTI